MHWWSFSVQDSGIGIALRTRPISSAASGRGLHHAPPGAGWGGHFKPPGRFDGAAWNWNAARQGSTFHFQLRIGAGAVEPPPALKSWWDDNAQAPVATWLRPGLESHPADKLRAGPGLCASAKAGQGSPSSTWFGLDYGIHGWSTGLRLRALMGSAPMPIFVMVSARGASCLPNAVPRNKAQINGFLIKPATTTCCVRMRMDHRSGAATAQAEPQKAAQPQRLTGMRLLVVGRQQDQPNGGTRPAATGRREVALADDGERVRGGAQCPAAV